MIITRQQAAAARHPGCSWTAKTLREEIRSLVPGTGDFELEELIDAWLARIADGSISPQGATDAAFCAGMLSGFGTPVNAFANPTLCLKVQRRLVVALRNDDDEPE